MPHQVAGAPATGDWPALIASAVTGEVCGQLRSRGFCIVDGALGEGASDRLRDEALALAALDGGFAPHMFQFGGSRERMMFRKPHIYEADLHDTRLHQLASLCSFRELFESCAFAKAFDAHMPELGLSLTTSGTTIKVQLNKGNGDQLRKDELAPRLASLPASLCRQTCDANL
jgi:hypothetical protein